MKFTQILNKFVAFTGISSLRHLPADVKYAVLENIHTPPHGRPFVLHPLPPGNSSLASYFASKILTFKTPLPLGISNDLPWDGYGFFSGTAQFININRFPVSFDHEICD